MTRGILICLTGIDGSGKTTLAKSLNDSLNKNGCNSTYVYARVTPIFSRLLMIVGRKILMIGSKDIFIDYNKHINNKKKYLKIA